MPNKPSASATPRDRAEHGLQRRIERVQEVCRDLAGHEVPLAHQYWELGDALDLVRDDFQHGAWRSFLKENKISPTRASHAQKIRRAFESPEDIHSGTLEEVLGGLTRRRRPRHERVPRDHGDLPNILLELSVQMSYWNENISQLETHEATNALKLALDCEKELARLIRRLRRRSEDNEDSLRQPQHGKCPK